MRWPKKKRESGLTPEEAAEQQALREAYLADFRRTLEGQAGQHPAGG